LKTAYEEHAVEQTSLSICR